MGDRRTTGIPTEELVQEALSRLIVLRPSEPVDLLKQLCQLRDVLVANPTTSLLVVDSMSAWQPLATAFPRAVAPVLREAWKALGRLQQEHCLAVVVTQREDSTGLSSASHFGSASSSASGLASRCCHVGMARRITEGLDGRASFATARRASAAAATG